MTSPLPGETQVSTAPTQGGTASASNQRVDFLFLVKIDNARVVSSILSTLYFGDKSEHANIKVDSKGIKVTVESPKSRSFQASTNLPAELFQEYNFNGSSEIEEFSVQTYILLDCLKIFGDASSNVALQLASDGPGKPLLLLLEENDVFTDCLIKHLDHVRLTNFDLRSVDIITDVVMKSESLKDAFDELDWSNEHLSWEISPEHPFFRLKTRGTGTTCVVDYPKDCEVFASFECEKTIKKDYRLKVIKNTMKALSYAKKTRVRINAVGLLSMQHMLETDDSQFAFVEFIIAPKEDGNDSDED